MTTARRYFDFGTRALLLCLVAACARNPVSYPRRDFNQQVLTETCRRFITRAAIPEYPTRAMQDHLSGYVVLSYALDGSGKAKNIRPVDARPPGVFDDAAVEALLLSDFDPEVKMDQCFSVMDFKAIGR